jgi:cell division protein ZapE
MLLGRLIRALFAQGVCLIATSNVAPDDLYKNGLQREQFLPAIELLKKDTQVLNIPTLSDYRLRHLLKAGVFYTPLDAAAQANMAKSFSILAQGQITYTTPIIIHDRPITVFSRAENVIWFDFMTICNPPRSQQDYLALASQFKTILISDIPKILPAAKNTIALFISLVDVLYDARVRLIISAAKGVSQLYEQGYLQAEYTRTQSRLLEMQSTDYFSGEV